VNLFAWLRGFSIRSQATQVAFVLLAEGFSPTVRRAAEAAGYGDEGRLHGLFRLI
jgi:hypothetical protein